MVQRIYKQVSGGFRDCNIVNLFLWYSLDSLVHECLRVVPSLQSVVVLFYQSKPTLRSPSSSSRSTGLCHC